MQARPSGRPGGTPLARAADWCFALQTWLMVACLVVMVVLLFGNVALRYHRAQEDHPDESQSGDFV